MTSSGISRRHHYVPKFLLRPWLHSDPRQQQVLRGVYWDAVRKEVRAKERGLDSFCFQIDLLSVKSPRLRSDVYEREFFLKVDTKGAQLRDRLLENELKRFSHEDRSDWTKVLLSLTARYPSTVSHARLQITKLIEQLNRNDEVLGIMDELGLTGKATDHYECHTKTLLEDRALETVRKLVDNPPVGGKITNFHWAVADVTNSKNSLILADRPLLRTQGIEHPRCVLALPLTPHKLFIAVAHQPDLISFANIRADRLARLMNRSSVQNAERFVFISQTSHMRWVSKHLRRTVSPQAS